MNKTDRTHVFGQFTVDTENRKLLHQTRTVSIAPKVFDILVLLLEKRGTLVDKEELRKKLFNDLEIDDNNIAQHISLLRKVIGDRADENNQYKYIQTVPRRGYRFVNSSAETFNSIAVLPFKSLPLDQDDEILGLGLADVLITKLGNIKQVSVRPTGSIMKYNKLTQDSIQAGKELKVDAVIEGKFHRAANRIRATVKLIRVKDGEQLWSGIFDENFTNIFAVEDSISDQVINALMLKLTGEEKEKVAKRQTENTEAHRLYLKGRYHLTKRTSEGILKGADCFEQAIKIDPSFASAYAGLADCTAIASLYSGRAPAECYPSAKKAALKALELDPNLAEAHASLGMIALDFDWEWETAEEHFKRAIALAPNLLDARQWYATLLLTIGRKEEALDQMNIAQEKDPISVVVNGDLALLNYLLGRNELALKHIEITLDLDPSFILVHFLKCLIIAEQGRLKEAEQEAASIVELTGYTSDYALAIWAYLLGRAGKKQKVEKIISDLNQFSKNRYVSPLSFIYAYLSMGEIDNAFHWLERAYDDRAWGMVHVPLDPIYAPIRGDKRFSILMNKMRIPNYPRN